MSVIVDKLTKIYGSQKAVNSISFSAKPGEILGFLGPNGAGKSTTMKMLTCFLEPTSGDASVCGYSILKDAVQVRRQIGYLPESNPLYKDMYVKEFLQFVAELVKVNKPKQRIEELIEMTGLGREQHKLIGALSKGYKQRVGLAQAMMSDPQVLILDEPTSGLDPNQLNDIRHLIKEIGQTKTLIFSTHIMQEVTALCDRVVIINQGNLVADDPIKNLQSKLNNNESIVVEYLNKMSANKLELMPNIIEVVPLDADSKRWRVIAEKDVRSDIFKNAVKNDLIILEMNKEEMNLENIFQELTKSTGDV